MIPATPPHALAPPHGHPPLGGPVVDYHNFEHLGAPYNQIQGYSDFANAFPMGAMPGGSGYHGGAAGPSSAMAGPSNGQLSNGYQYAPVHQYQHGNTFQSTHSSTYDQSGAVVQSRQLTATGQYYGGMYDHTAGNLNHPPAMAPPDAHPFPPAQQAMYHDLLAALEAPVPAPSTGALPRGPMFQAELAAEVPGGAANFGQAIDTGDFLVGLEESIVEGAVLQGALAAQVNIGEENERAFAMICGLLPDEGSFHPTEGPLGDSLVGMPHGVVRTNTRKTTRGHVRSRAPYPPSRVAAPSTDPSASNFTSITNIVLGGIQDNINDGVQPSHHGAAQAVAGPATNPAAPANKVAGWKLARSYWGLKEFLDHLTPAQHAYMCARVKEDLKRKGGGWPCGWVDNDGAPCTEKTIFQDHKGRDRHIYDVHHHHEVRVGDETFTRPLPGVVEGGRYCRFCPEYISRLDGGHNALRHEWSCNGNPDRGPVGSKFPGKRKVKILQTMQRLSTFDEAMRLMAARMRRIWGEGS
ncbi:unnamed protein product [Peniophora sp. CBMAI 1063]|nr:unnamed protein product [Peniophora sp. CBMAI 1063]